MKKWLVGLSCRRRHDEADDIFVEMDRVFRVPRLVGMWPLFCSNHSFRISYSLLLLNILFATSAMVLSTASAVILNIGVKTQFVYRVFSLLQMFGYAFSPFAALFPLFKLHQLNRFLAKVSSAELPMRRIGFQQNCITEAGESLLRWTHRICFLMILSFRLITVRLTMYFWVLVLYWPIFYALVMLDQLESSMEILRTRLDGVVVAARQVVSNSATFRKLEELARCHYILCKSGSLLNSFYSVTFLLLTAFYFVITVGELYAVYYHRQPSHFDQYTFVIKAFWVLLGVAPLLRITYSCVRTTSKANEFNVLLSHLMSNEKTNQILNNVIATTATYMVILMQFDAPPNSANSALPIVGETANHSTPFTLAIGF